MLQKLIIIANRYLRALLNSIRFALCRGIIFDSDNKIVEMNA